MAKDFVDTIRNFRHKVERRTTEVYRKSCADISYRIADKTPCSTGRLLGSWSPSTPNRSRYNFEGGPSAWEKGVKDEGVASTNRSRAMRDLGPRIDSVTASLIKANPYYFTNGVPYAHQAEYIGWEVTDAQFMVLRSRQEWQAIVNMFVKEVAARG